MNTSEQTEQRLPELGEFGLIGRIASRVGPSEHVAIGIGDDAAAFRWQAGSLGLATSDMLLEGVHFDLSYCDPRRLGRKSLAVNLSDMAAMGGKPRSFLLSLGLPPSVQVGFIDAFVAGMLELAGEFGVTLVGGDTCSSRSGLVISVTLYGEQEHGRILRRGGARPGDALFVTGAPGDSALGLELLRKGLKEGSCIERHLDPRPRVREGLALADAGLATAMIDISDGLLADLGHIADSSGVGARIRLDRLPLSAEFAARFDPERERGYSMALGGGEDYELLFTATPERSRDVRELFSRFGTPVTEIGEITSNHGIVVLSPEGEAVSMGKQGYDHFQPGEPGK